VRTIVIDEYLVVNVRTGKRKWTIKMPKSLSSNDVLIKVRGKVILPDAVMNVDFGTVTVPELNIESPMVQ
jgi:hypothetical protein